MSVQYAMDKALIFCVIPGATYGMTADLIPPPSGMLGSGQPNLWQNNPNLPHLGQPDPGLPNQGQPGSFGPGGHGNQPTEDRANSTIERDPKLMLRCKLVRSPKYLTQRGHP